VGVPVPCVPAFGVSVISDKPVHGRYAMSNALTTSPKVFSSVSSTNSRFQSSSGGDGLLQPRTNGLRSGSFSGISGNGGVVYSGPGSFTSTLRTNAPSIHTTMDADPGSPSTPETPERQLEELTQQLNKEIKFKEGAENMLQALDSKKLKEAKVARNKAEMELSAVNSKIAQLKHQMEAIKNPKEPPRSTRGGHTVDNLLGNPVGPLSNGAHSDELLGTLEGETESPTFSLSEVLQSVEEKGRKPEFYVEKANSLVLLFKRHPMLKYDLVWSEFGQMVQSMLLHENREVVAAGYRITRYAITDIDSLRTIRKLETDYLTIW